MIDAILWDLGGVLCEFHRDRRVAALAQLSGRSPQQVDGVIDAELRRNLDRGRVSASDLLDHIRRGLDWDCEYTTLVSAWSAAFVPDERVLAVARLVNVANGLLSDNGPPLADNFANCLPEVAAVKATPVFTSDIGTTKPSPEAFTAACHALAVEPARVLLIDDNPTNVVGASEAGLASFRYTGPAHLHRHLTGQILRAEQPQPGPAQPVVVGHTGVMDVDFKSTSPEDPAATQMLREAEDSLIAMYGSCSDIPRSLFAPPDGGYIVGWDNSRPIAGGGFTLHIGTTAEIRRMFVVPSARSRGVARKLLTAIEVAARQAGYERVILDTGPMQDHAESLYRSAGYEDIENYRSTSTRGSYWGAKSLLPATRDDGVA